MNGPHDLGGSHGFGPVAIEPGEPVFHEDWERRIFGVSFAVLGRVANLDEFRYGRERIPPPDYLTASYYEKWIVSLEMILVEKGVFTQGELEETRRRFAVDPGASLPSWPDTGLGGRLLEIVYGGGSSLRELASKPRYAAGDAVRTRNTHEHGHTRLPRYVRGKRGLIELVHEAFVLPDTNALGRGEEPEYVYSVTFAGEELWGDSAEPRTRVTIDLWESYLLPASEKE